MRKTFFTPGPAQLFPTVEKHIHTAIEEQIGSISHRSQAFMDIHKATVEKLRSFLGFSGEHVVFFHSSATEIWERLLQNGVEQKCFHYVNGAFSQRFFSFSQQLHIPKIIKEQAEWGQSFSYDPKLIPPDVEMINFTHNESSTGVMMPLEKARIIREAFPETILTLDMVSSIPYGNVDWKVWDAVYFSVQKGMGLPAGLGVLILNQKCLKKAEYLHAKGKVIGTYHSFLSQFEKYQKHQTVETPNILGIYLLGAVLADMEKIGLATIQTETERKAAKVFETIQVKEGVSFFVSDSLVRSPTVITVHTGEQTSSLIKYLADKGLIVGSGYGKLKSSQIRIANFPAISFEEMERLIEAIQAFEFQMIPSS